MRIQMLTTAAGPGGIYQSGAVVDIAEALATEFIAGGYAIALDSPAFEAAVIDPPSEKAVLPRKAGRPKRAR